MAKSIITIEEEHTKDENGRTLLKRLVKSNIFNHEDILYEDIISPTELHNDNTPLNIFERWIIDIHTDKTSTLKK